MGVAEDAFITFRYAQNWVAGNGLVWNPGEAPVEGYTNFLWVVLAAAFLTLNIDPIAGSQWIGMAASVAVLFLLFRAGTLHLGWRSGVAAIPCIALAASGPFATWAGAGLETNLFTLWILAAGIGFSRATDEGRPSDFYSAGLMLLFASLTRPEGLLVAGVFVAGSFWRARGRTSTVLRRLSFPALIYAGLYALYTSWRWWYFGDPLPNTFYAKTGGGIAQAQRGLEYASLFALHFLSPWIGVVVLSLASRRSDEETSPLIRLSLVLAVTWTIYVVLVGGDYMAMYRFFVPVLPFIYLLLAAAFQRAWQGGHARRLLYCMLVFAIALGFVHSTPLEAHWISDNPRMHGNHRGVETERWYVARQKLIGEFFARYGKNDESIATSAIGAIAYFSNLRVYDVHGIVDAHIAHEGGSAPSLGSGLAGHEKSDYRYIFEKKPTFYVFNRRLFPRPLPALPRLVPEVDDIVARDYRVGSVWLDDKANGESGYFAFLERRDRGSVQVKRPED